MKRVFMYLLVFTFCLYLSSCKSAQSTLNGSDVISVEDFHPLDQHISSDSKAIKLSEVVDVRMEDFRTAPWTRYNGASSYPASSIGWRTTVEEKILFLTDSIDNEPFCSVSYFNPIGMRWNLMTKCNIWLYTLEKAGNINKRKIKANELIHERVNDSICKIQLKMQKDVAGKILVRQYVLSSPYYTIQSESFPIIDFEDYGIAKVEPWIFQKDIPLLYGKYEIRLPEGSRNKNRIENKVYKLGKGEMNITSEKTEVTYTSYNEVNTSTMNRDYSREGRTSNNTYTATKVCITVSNVLPLPKNSNLQPLGIDIVRYWNRIR